MAASRRSGSRFETDFKGHLDARGLTFEDLKARQCPDKVLLKLSEGLDNWDIVGLYLEIKESDIKAIRRDNDSEERRRVALLRKWKQKNGDNATYENLVSGLCDAERIDIADQALDYLKENIIEIRRQQKTAWQEQEVRQREERRQQEIQLDYEMKEKGTLKVESQASEAEAKQVTEEAYKKQWDEYYMRIACLAALKSKISTPAGACIVDNKSRIVRCGYNSIPIVEGEDSDEARKKNKKENEHIGAAVDAIMYKTRKLDGCTIYLTSYPDKRSADAIQVAGIKEVVYCMYTRKEEREKELDMEKIGKFFKANNIETREMTMSNEGGVAKILHDRIKESKALEQVEGPEQLDASSGPHGTITWEEFFMGIAILSTRTPRPYDRNPKLAVGACIVSPSNQVMAIGYSGYPKDMIHDDISQEGDQKGYIIHAEYKAIIELSSSDLVKNCKLYVTSHPCHECAKLIVKCGISKVVYAKDKGDKPPKFTLENLITKKCDLTEGEFYNKL